MTDHEKYLNVCSAIVDNFDFGGGAGAGVTIQPLCFLIEREGDVKILNINPSRTTADALVNMVPEAIDRVSSLIAKNKEKKAEEPQAQPAAPAAE